MRNHPLPHVEKKVEFYHKVKDDSTFGEKFLLNCLLEKLHEHAAYLNRKEPNSGNKFIEENNLPLPNN